MLKDRTYSLYSTQRVDLSIELPKAELCLRAEDGVSWKTIARGSAYEIAFCVSGVILPVAIGMTPEERSMKQNISFDFSFKEKADTPDDTEIPYGSFITNICEVRRTLHIFR